MFGQIQALQTSLRDNCESSVSDITRPVPGKVLTCCTAPLVKGTMCQSLQGHPGGESCDGTDINIGIDIDVADINKILSILICIGIVNNISLQGCSSMLHPEAINGHAQDRLQRRGKTCLQFPSLAATKCQK